jgi:vanillate O-demethylase ferredoxin subunit
MNTIAVRVVNITQEAEDIRSFELVSADGTPLPPSSAGAHIDVRINGGITRQYSLCNASLASHFYQIGVLRDANSRGGSWAMHDVVKEGDILQISAPRNHFPLVHAKHSLLFAGGIGITPILCMAEHLSRTDANFTMHYCTRSKQRTAFMGQIMDSPFANDVHFHFGTGATEQKFNAFEVLNQAEQDTHLYVCGPRGFIEHVVNTANSLGWSSEKIHLEYFGMAAPDTSGDNKFEVKIASTGKSYVVPADKTVIQILADNGIEIPVSCEQGVCGTCATRILDGIPDHRDAYFTDMERAKNDVFTPCCSRSMSNTLVLDI